ncbi:MAG: lysylphosphatidylglycerol synthase domain-containing protein [Gemmatimonadetes bacterium]|nr:lysylphosphatidylglycerol synthase domain-containing protein [Gemmatimonadota bacterium]
MRGSIAVLAALVKAGVSLCLLTLLFWLVASPEELSDNLLAADPLYLLLALAGSLAGVAIQWRKWHELLLSIRPATRAGESLRSLLVGFSLGMVSPGRVGELGRGALFEGRRVEAVTMAFLDRALSAGITISAAVIGLAFIDLTLALAGGVAMAAAGGLLFRHGGALPAGLQKRGLAKPWNAAAARLSTALRSISRALLLRVLLWSFLFNLVFFAQFYLLALSWIELPPRGIAAVPIVFGLKTLAPVGFLDLGPREAASAFVFSRIGLDPVPAVNAALLLWLLNLALPAIAGGVWVSVAAARKLFERPLADSVPPAGEFSPACDRSARFAGKLEGTAGG